MERKELKDRAFLMIARTLSTLGTCSRRKVGCVMVDSRHRIIASGYNGVAPNVPHCTEIPCPGSVYPSGQGLEFCEAIHAEQNAIIQLKDMDSVAVVYCTTAPCMHCVKMIARTSCKRIVFSETYPQAEAAKTYWEAHGGSWEHFPKEAG